MASTDVLIIGAGWSGLSAALRLSQAGRKVVVVEARQRIGGRAFTHSWNDDTTLNDTGRNVQQDAAAASSAASTTYTCDFGCSWMHGYNEGSPLKALVERYGIEAHVPNPTKTVLVGDKGALPADLATKIGANLAAAQDAARDLAQNRGSTRPPASQSLASFLLSPSSPLFDGLSSDEHRHAAGLARSLHVPLGATLEQVGLRFNGFEHNYAGTDAAPAGGFTRLIKKVADEAISLGAEIRTGLVVDRIALADDGKSVVVSTRSSAGDAAAETTTTNIEAKTAVCTIPLAVLKENVGIFKPSLPERRQAIISRTYVGNLNKVLLAYDEAWWDKEVGTFMVLPTRDAPSDASSGSLQDLFASTTLIVSSLCAPNGFPSSEPSPAGCGGGRSSSVSNSLLVMVGADAGKAIEAHDRVEVGRQLHAYLAQRLAADGGAGKGPKHIFYSRWAKQPFTRGATTTPVVVGEDNSPLDFTELGRPLWEGRLGFAGEHTDQDHRGSAAGAYVSGEREADRLLAFLNKHHAQAQQQKL
ncbi:uncharacterized protein PFL1_02698 [Pseudozyma flocculosa PF-1]|uniref:Related to FMS1 - polyamine oxidase, converts spermine to spermidine n=2 Tax=Pseudozyma flocculosa TaxID=84751 RepID=A0A5C3EZS7_9BASI|nr:uncharacterized protein PFL1_02698 [Pseudozyma flocculosa PF-1]EPQ30025.1 hypothetical protein PFL1_02698 [Pseudozyma flocculosa PF-1]SPO37350.1 related to FMS1 - polyamine oxidase, converts spermine to spermidine [Pseudozyma flocculosa]